MSKTNTVSPLRQRMIEERPRPREISLITQYARETVQGQCRFGMLGSERFLTDRKRALLERPRPRKVALAPHCIG